MIEEAGLKILASALDIHNDLLRIVINNQREIARAILAVDRNDTIINSRQIKKIAGVES